MRKQLMMVTCGIMAVLAVAASAGLVSVDLLRRITSSAPAVTAVPAQTYIDQGKFYLTSRNILAARDQFRLAVQSDPANQEANLLYGVTRIAAVAEDGQSLNTAGLDSVREIFELAGFVFSKFGIYDTVIQAGPKVLPSSTPRTGAVLDFLKTKLLPEVDGAIANLAVVTNTAFASDIDAAMFRNNNGPLTIDYADALVIKALLQALKCNLELVMVYGLDVSLPDVQAAPDQLMTYKLFFTADPTLLTPKDPARLTTARAALLSFIDGYTLASQYLAARSGSAHHLFVIDVPLTNEALAADTLRLNQVKQVLAEVKASLNGPYHYSFITGKLVQKHPEAGFIDLSKLFDAANPINFRTNINDLASGVASATTLNGLFPLGVTGFEPFLEAYGPHILGVTGAGPGTPVINVRPKQIIFYSASQPVTISNHGTTSLHVSGMSLKGPNSTDFTLSAGTCGSLTPTLTPGGSCSVTVELNQAATFGYTFADLQIVSDDAAVPVSTIELIGMVQGSPALPVGTNVVVADPTAPGTVYAGTQGSGVYKSTNSGVTWFQVNTGLNDLYIYDLIIDPGNGQNLYAATYNGVYRTTNGGSAWTLPVTLYGVNKIVVAPSSPSTMYAATYSGFYRSTDSGTSWTSTGTPGDSITSLAVDPLSPATVYAGTISGVQKSFDGGTTWNAINNGLVNSTGSTPGVNHLLITSSTTIYAATSSGLFKSTTGGSSWITANSGLGNFPYSKGYFFSETAVYALTALPSNPQVLYAASSTAGGGIYQSTDAAVSWQPLGYPSSSFQDLAVNSTGTTLFGATYSGVSTFSTTAYPGYLLSIQRNGTGSGSVSYDLGYTVVNGSLQQNTITCPTSCSNTYLTGNVLELKPQTEAGSVFAGWTGCDALTGDLGEVCRVTMVAAKNVTATFNRDPLPLAVLASPPGGSYLIPPTITLGASKGATVYYTLNGATPTAASTRYTGPFTLGGPTTLKFIAVDPFGAASAVKTETYTGPKTVVLTMRPSGTGGGSVNSEPSGLIACTYNSPTQSGTCSATPPAGTQATLTSTRDGNSRFGGWGGDCATCGTGLSCPVNFDADKTCTATFTFVKPARIAGSTPLREFDSIQAAYDDPLTVSGDVIQVREYPFPGNLNLGRQINVTIKGGYDIDYLTRTGYSLLRGIMTVGKGSVITDRLTVE